MKNKTEIDRLFDIWLKYHPTEEAPKPEYNKQVTIDIKKLYRRKVSKKNKPSVKKEIGIKDSQNFMESMLSKNYLEEKSAEIIFSEENIIEKKEREHVAMTEQEFSDMEKANKNRKKKRKNKFKTLLGK